MLTRLRRSWRCPNELPPHKLSCANRSVCCVLAPHTRLNVCLSGLNVFAQMLAQLAVLCFVYLAWTCSRMLACSF